MKIEPELTKKYDITIKIGEILSIIILGAVVILFMIDIIINYSKNAYIQLFGVLAIITCAIVVTWVTYRSVIVKDKYLVSGTSDLVRFIMLNEGVTIEEISKRVTLPEGSITDLYVDEKDFILKVLEREEAKGNISQIGGSYYVKIEKYLTPIIMDTADLSTEHAIGYVMKLFLEALTLLHGKEITEDIEYFVMGQVKATFEEIEELIDDDKWT